MQELQEEGTAVDFCAACGGIWLDKGELEAKGAKLPDGLARVTLGAGRECPRCAAALATMRGQAVEIFQSQMTL